jgi:hypothetical protein
MVKESIFKVIANKNIGGKRELERYENGTLVKIIAGKGKKRERAKLSGRTDGEYVRQIDSVVQDKEFEVLEIFSDVSWLDVAPKERKRKQLISDKTVSVVTIRIRNNKVIEKGESVVISSKWSPSAAEIKEAFRIQLGRELKSSPSTDFFKIEKL